MVRTQIQLTDDQAKGLKKLAAEQGRSMADLVRDGVDLVLGRERQESRAARMQRASRVFGQFRSKTGDLSRRHDEHFADASESR
jgi:Arc/MetJ-type ribon-helix-helix transcriptional regulator